ncbi:MAG: 2OG-Fe(II) oxygenase [Acidobacteria bacterium]|nr:2OG-Fe(II) oxygenase [Acidobacteriota bacterium]
MNVQQRLGRLNWRAMEQSLWKLGYAKTPPLLTPEECAELVSLYPDDAHFRSRIDMARYRFGVGDYKYFARPLPPVVEELRVHFYPPLAAVANRWMEALGETARYPARLVPFLSLCHRRGQAKPTPLLLHYEAGGYNCLHQDLYGEVAFPLQLTCFLSRRGEDYTGGEFLLVEQRPRAQSKGEAILAEQGEILIFTTRHRPVAGARGYYKVNVRHGVSRITSGVRYTLGVIFHDAR